MYLCNISNYVQMTVITNRSALDKVSLELSDMLITAFVHCGSGILLLFLLGLVSFSLCAHFALSCLHGSLRFPLRFRLARGCLDCHGLRIAREAIV